jgi:hypothetical protein
VSVGERLFAAWDIRKSLEAVEPLPNFCYRAKQVVLASGGRAHVSESTQPGGRKPAHKALTHRLSPSCCASSMALISVSSRSSVACHWHARSVQVGPDLPDALSCGWTHFSFTLLAAAHGPDPAL